ncbi:MAG: NEW3 domain-containing protein, partial [Euryarchaeota archaeon]|nr:NEW3 domain-containing protein [Euryarchaeota archaeon]
TGTPATGTTALTIKDRPVLELTLSKNATMVDAGDSVRLNYTVTNSGSDDAANATDVNVSLALPDGWSLSTGTVSYNLGTIAPGANKAGYWIVTADDPNATNTLTVTVTSTIPGGTVAGAYAFGATTVPGDVTGDGNVNIGDATLLFNWVSFVNERGSTYALAEAGNADVTGDGNVNIGDATLLFNWVSFVNERGSTYVLY